MFLSSNLSLFSSLMLFSCRIMSSNPMLSKSDAVHTLGVLNKYSSGGLL